MDKPSKLATQTLRISKKEAKKLRRAQGIPLHKCHEKLAVEAGYDSLHDLTQAAKHELLALEHRTTSTVLEPQFGQYYRLRIGSSVWALAADNQGPQLCLEWPNDLTFRDYEHVSRLGLYPLIVKNWPLEQEFGITQREVRTPGCALTRYGSYFEHGIDFLTDGELTELSFHFGIPIVDAHNNRRMDWCPNKQRERSEAAFLKSPAFEALRKQLRNGKPLPRFDAWSSGLSSVHCLLIALDDRDFAAARDALVDYYILGWGSRFSAYAQSRAAMGKLESSWSSFESDAPTPSFGLERAVPPRIRSLLSRA